jgi:hypothetical protein
MILIYNKLIADLTKTGLAPRLLHDLCVHSHVYPSKMQAAEMPSIPYIMAVLIPQVFDVSSF